MVLADATRPSAVRRLNMNLLLFLRHCRDPTRVRPRASRRLSTDLRQAASAGDDRHEGGRRRKGTGDKTFALAVAIKCERPDMLPKKTSTRSPSMSLEN